MKVMCIKSVLNYRCDIVPIVKIGENYNVIDTTIDEMGEYYELEEHIGFLYLSDKFVTLSDIDETIFERNYNTETT